MLAFLRSKIALFKYAIKYIKPALSEQKFSALYTANYYRLRLIFVQSDSQSETKYQLTLHFMLHFMGHFHARSGRYLNISKKVL